MPIDTPVAIVVFNRPDTTRKVLSGIAQARPRKLFVIADGPRNDHPEDIEKCAAVRKIFDRLDWKCEVSKRYLDTNLGCGKGPAMGISWVFDHVEQAIILEDDCVADSCFFNFCEEILKRYQHDQRIMMVSGRSNLYDRKPRQYSYYLSRLPSCWGWGTWRRAWRYFDIKVRLWPSLRDTSWLSDIMLNSMEIDYWKILFDKAYADAGEVDYWDYQWAFACWAHQGLAVLPTTNLIRNIGFGEHATHTKSWADKRAKANIGNMAFPLRHPPHLVRDRDADRVRYQYYAQSMSSVNPFFQRRVAGKLSTLKRHLKRYVNGHA